MTDPSRANGTSPDQLEADIARQREQLADTVDALHARLDVKTRATDRVHELVDRATTESGQPRPQVVAAAVATLALVGGLVVLRVRHAR